MATKQKSKGFGGLFYRSKQRAQKIEELASKEETPKLEEDEISSIIHRINQLSEQKAKLWWQIGQAVKLLENGTPNLTAKERNDQFYANLKIGYQLAKKAMRVYTAYRNSPEEVEEYGGLTAADLLKDFPPAERKRIWAKTGSLQKLRIELREMRKGQAPAPQQNILRLSKKTKTLVEGLRIAKVGDRVKLEIDMDELPEAKALLEGLISKLTKTTTRLVA